MNAPMLWRRTLVVTVVLLLLWLAVTFWVPYHAREWNVELLGWPFGFWMAAQGALLIYVLLISAYAWIMNRLERDGDGDGDDMP
jgi:putative solute:sodium symporter small subunit